MDAGDTHHSRAVELILRTAGQPLTMPGVTMAEAFVRHVRAGVGRQAMALLREVGVRTAEDRVDALRLAELRVETGLRMPDVIVLAAAEATTEPLATFDRRLARVATERGVVVLPEGGPERHERER